MTGYDIKTLDTLDSSDYLEDQLSDEELEIPPHMVPPNPDDSEILPSHVHPSYPYGNPTNLNHPAALPRVSGEPIRALYQDIGYFGGNVNATLRWKELGLDLLLPVNEAKEEALKAAIARKMASGGAAQGNHPPGVTLDGQTLDDEDEDSEEEEEDGEEEDDGEEEEEEEYENDASRESFDSIAGT
ncbi:hypothetical protein Clacol_003892 [Clathrus columnatus]|uniref:Uncharacterized protein n=1 Tax=Clathrus columnatus TaxID=1419009 RepID=A0AAV5A915_9AGAM|nr:hypothetical protein Clacol_003892 [Clathrus columnatus]